MRRAPSILAALLTITAPLVAAADAAGRQPDQTTTPIQHVVVLMQEHHSFDSYFGTYPGADGIPAGTCMPVDPGRLDLGCVKPHGIANGSVEDHPVSAATAAGQLDGGRMDGFLSAIQAQSGRLDPNVMGQYSSRDLAYYWNVADHYVLFDHFFASSRGGSVSNRMYWVAGRPGIRDPSQELIPEGGFDLPTIFDRLEAKGVSWKFYVQNYNPNINFRTRTTAHRGSRAVGGSLLNLPHDSGSQTARVPLLDMARYVDDPDLARRIVPIQQYYKDLATGNLPAVSYIASSGSSERAPGSIGSGQALVRNLIASLATSTAWSTSAFMWTYDDWGGSYDHVLPPAVDRFGYGFRVPALLVSPYAKPGTVEHSTLDFTSILKFVETNWQLRPLARRDRTAGSIAGAFDFSAPARSPILLGDSGSAGLSHSRTAVAYFAYGLSLAVFILILALSVRSARRSSSRQTIDEVRSR
ncbi:MAG: alkaline phosphatase family protein [Solirubrobacterales bacterium]